MGECSIGGMGMGGTEWGERSGWDGNGWGVGKGSINQYFVEIIKINNLLLFT